MSGHRSHLYGSVSPILVERRIRHLAAIQIGNLTPFPARDSLASALTQPSEQPQFTSHGHLSDDLDVAIQRKRSRRISGNSVATLRSVRSEDAGWEEESPGGTLSDRGQRKTAPRVSFPSEEGDNRHHSATPSAPTVRPRRARTSSMASSLGSHISGPSHLSSPHSGGVASVVPSSFSTMLPDNSQAGLENVIHSRLVETFLVITIPPGSDIATMPSDHVPQTISPSPSSTVRDKTSSPKFPESKFVRKAAKPLLPVPVSRTTTTISRGPLTSPRSASKFSPSPSNSASSSTLRMNGKVKVTSPQPTSLPSEKSPTRSGKPWPNYFSPIHRPSTHPYFAIDTHTFHGFTEGWNLRVEIWGRVGPGWKDSSMGKGKEKEHPAGSEVEWKALQHWDVDLRDLIPLSETSVTSSVHNSSNSLLITLSPPGQTFYLPSHPSTPSRSFSPIDGYASDPESGPQKVKQLDSKNLNETAAVLPRRRHRGGGGATPLFSPETSKTPNWQDLFKLATIQSSILDNEGSLSDVVRGIDRVLESDETFVQRREVPEREARLEELMANRRKVLEESELIRNAINTRLEDLRQRKDLLKLARERLREDIDCQHDIEESIGLDRLHHSALRARFGPIRTTLFTNVSSIYPIELLSPPDLLYTVLDVPLPIPLSSTDPAPPLTLPSHKDVTEDVVATSLGYAAQVVQLIAMYLGKNLTYPVTCIGSRSLIRDNISAMVGPRMFPLYSKGVDTYRFEYGVFLLNKDIELLMADRELRALDMRHTLPNLKNLLLTLTDGEGAHLQETRISDSPISLTTELQSSSRPESPVDPNSTTPKASSVVALEGNSPPASGSTTPTAAAMDAAKKSRPFLVLSPFTDFLRGRYPSSSRISVKSIPDMSEEVQESEERQATSATDANPERDEGGDNDINRRLISGVVLAVGIGEESDSALNGEGEKVDGDGRSPAHISPAYPLTSVL